MVFPVGMYGCESWTVKKAERWRIDAFELWCWRRVLDCQEIQPVRPKGDQSWVFIGKIDAEAEAPIFGPPDVKSWLTEKDSDGRKDGRQEEKWITVDEMAEWHQWLNGHVFEQTLGVVEGQGNLHDRVLGGAELDTIEWLNNNNIPLYM